MYTYTCCMQLRHLCAVCVTTGSHVCTIVCTRAMKHTHHTTQSQLQRQCVRGVWAMETLHVRASLHRRDTSSVCVCVGCLRRFTLSVDCGVCACECVVAWCVCPRVSYTRAKQRDRDATQCSVAHQVTDVGTPHCSVHAHTSHHEDQVPMDHC